MNVRIVGIYFFFLFFFDGVFFDLINVMIITSWSRLTLEGVLVPLAGVPILDELALPSSDAKGGDPDPDGTF